MADIELLIKIPEEYYKSIKEIPVEQSTADMLIIKNGTPLPKGHGRLIDADVLCNYFWDNRSKLYTRKDLQIVIDGADTIIEADKGEVDGK